MPTVVISPDRTKALEEAGKKCIEAMRPLSEHERVYVLTELLDIAKKFAGVDNVEIKYYDSHRGGKA